ISRAIRFNLGVSENGITGCTFRTKRVCLSGPTFCSQLNWKGTLTRSEMGFDSFLAKSASSPAAAGWPADDWARALVDRQHTKEMAASAEVLRYGVSISLPSRIEGYLSVSSTRQHAPCR